MKKQYIYAAISILCWSTVSTITKLLLNDSINNIQLLWVSSFFAGLFLFIVNLFSGKLKLLFKYKPRDFFVSAAIGLPGTFLYYLFYYFGTSQMPASQAFIINYLWPIMSLLFATIILKEKFTLRNAFAIGISFLGIVVIMIGEIGKQTSSFWIGAVSCILGAVSYGIFTALNKKYTYDKSLSMMINYLVTFVLTTIINAISNKLFFPNTLQCIGIAWNGIFTMAIASTLWILALADGATGKISNLAYITPFLSLVWASLFLEEKLTGNSILGLVIIILGIVIQLRSGKKDTLVTLHNAGK